MKPATSNLARSWGLPKAHHKIPPRRKSGRGPGFGEFPRILGLPFNISATAEVSDFKFGMKLRFANWPNQKIRASRKKGVPWARGVRRNLGFPLIFLQRLKLATSKLASSWGFWCFRCVSLRHLYINSVFYINNVIYRPSTPRLHEHGY